MMDLPDCLDQDVRGKMNEYVWGMANWVTANYEWSVGTVRYKEEKKVSMSQIGYELKQAHLSSDSSVEAKL